MPQFNLIEVLIIQAAAIGGVIIGFVMGWRAKRPDARILDKPQSIQIDEYEDP